MSGKAPPPNTKHRKIIRNLPIKGKWRTFTELWDELPYPRPGWKQFRHALLRGRDHGYIDHVPPTSEMRQRFSRHRGYWRVIKHPEEKNEQLRRE